MEDIFAGVLPCWDGILKGPMMYNMLSRIIAQLPEQNLSPARNMILNAFRYVELADLDVIIIGQDPYINPGESHGLSFSVPAGIKIPPSLINIYSALAGPTHNGNLEYWAAQGVLLLNGALTTVMGKSNVHAELWKEYTDLLLVLIISAKPSIILILWGEYAKKKKQLKQPQTFVLEWRHPSPMSNNSAPEPLKFNNCDNFAKANEWLIKNNKPPIDWQKGTLQRIYIFTDGAASANGSADCLAGWGVYVPAKPFYSPAGRKSIFFGHETEVRLAGKVEACEAGPATNNRAELGAILQGLLWLMDKVRPPTLVTIVSDSQYSIGMITEWGPKRINDGSIHEKKNHELVTLIINALNIARNNGFIIDFHHMRGHNRDKYVCDQFLAANEIVDKLAGQK